jgi:uncharacterized coiled-coil protein SlyX
MPSFDAPDRPPPGDSQRPREAQRRPNEAQSRPSEAERIAKLETLLAHQQHLWEQLNEVVTDQAGELLRLRRALGRFESQLEELQEKPSAPADPLDEKPPHY